MTNDMVKKTSVKEYPWEETEQAQTLFDEPAENPKEETIEIPKVNLHDPEEPREEKKKEQAAKEPAPAPEEKKVDPDKEVKIKKYMNDKVIGDFTQQEMDVLKNTIASGTNKEEFRLFVQTCVNTGLNPFLNHIYPIVFDGKHGRKLNLQISVEGIMYLARKVPGYKGVDVQLVHENDEFRMKRENNIMSVSVHEFGLPRGQVVGGYAVARREGFADAIVVMETEEVKDMKTGRNKDMWTKWFNDMFKKHILKRAAKEQYGIELTEEPVPSGPSIDDFKKEEKFVEIGENQKEPLEELKKKLWASIYQIADDKAMNVTEVNDLIYEKFPNKERDQLNAQQLAALQKFVEFYKKEDKSKEEGVVDVEFDEVEERPKEEPKEEDPYENAFD